MTNQEVLQALEEFVQIEQRLMQLYEDKTELEREIKYYQIQREEPVPERPSKAKVFLIDLGICIVGLELLGCIVGPIAPILAFLLAPLLACIIAPIHYRKENADACGEFITESLMHDDWKKGRQERLPVLQNQLNQVMNEGANLYRTYQNARARTYVHIDYLPHAKTLLEYFYRGRARDLTEAINLLEYETREHDRDLRTAEYRNEIRQQVQAQTKATERAAVAAEDMAFWSAATTYIVASEVDRQRKKDRSY